MREKPICKHYIAAHQCAKGKDAEVLGLCQHCTKWVKDETRKGPVRPDNKRKKLEKASRKDKYDY